MSTSESSNGSYLDSPASCSWSSESTQRIFTNNVVQPAQKSGPYIEILEQPQSHTRFRYNSEGEHGYLYGINTTKVLTTYPTVQLVNYKGSAHIRCQLFQYDKEEKHLHKLKFNGEENQNLVLHVDESCHYTVCFETLSFVTKSIRTVSQEIRSQYVETHPRAALREVNKYCKKLVNNINFKIVRLRFSAHDVQTGEEICHAYSKPIYNSKHAETNKLRIVRGINLSGEARGGGETTLLVEKITKNVKVRFVEPGSGWSEMAHIDYRHHDYAIVCKSPPYKEKNLACKVEVYIELVRETDGATSNRMPFIYKKSPMLNLKRTFPLPASHTLSVDDNLDHLNTESSVKIKKISDESYWTPQVCKVPVSQNRWVPTQSPQQLTLQDSPFPETAHNDEKSDANGHTSNTDSDIHENGNNLSTYSDEDIWNILDSLRDDSRIESALIQSSTQSSPVLSEEVGQSENMLERDNDSILHNNPVLGEASVFFSAHPASTQANDVELFSQLYQTWDMSDYYGPDNIMNGTAFQELIADSPPPYELCSAQRGQPEDESEDEVLHSSVHPLFMKGSVLVEKIHSTISELLKMEKLKKLVKDIISVTKRSGPKSYLQTKLEQLFGLKLPYGNTFLHITVNLPMFSSLVRALHAVNMAYLLDMPNDLNQTVLHVAVLNELPHVVRMLISEGCDPMLVDVDGNNAIHLAVTSYSTLAALFNAMAAYKVPFDVNATNYDNQTPLHVATINDSETSLRLLLKSGADIKARDHCGRTALHLAASYDSARAVSVLLHYMDGGDVDVTDSRGQTALQTACDSDMRENTLAIILLLLKANADPTKREGKTVSAVKLSRRHPDMCVAILGHMSAQHDSDDEYLTADEGEHEDCTASKLQGIKINEVKCYECA